MLSAAVVALGVALSVLFIPIREESFRHAAMNLSFGKQKKSLNCQILRGIYMMLAVRLQISDILPVPSN